MERRLPQSTTLIAIAFLAGACDPGQIGAGRRAHDTPKEGARGAPSSDLHGGKPDHEPGYVDLGDRVSVTGRPQGEKERSENSRTDPAASTAVDDGAGKESLQSVITLRRPAKREDIAPSEVGPQPERPWAYNTGPSDPKALTPSGKLKITTDGVELENLEISGTVTIDADNVTIRNFRISATGFYGIKILEGHRGIVIEDGEIFNMTSSGILGMGFTARRLHIHDSGGDGIKAQGAGGPVLVEYCFIEKLGTNTEAHADGNQTRGGSNITFRYNNIFMPHPGTPRYPGSPYKSNAAFMISGNVSNFVIERNWLTGGAYTIYCQNTGGSGVFVRGNRFGCDNGGWSAGKEARRLRAGSCAEWSGNRWEESGEPI